MSKVEPFKSMQAPKSFVRGCFVSFSVVVALSSKAFAVPSAIDLTGEPASHWQTKSTRSEADKKLIEARDLVETYYSAGNNCGILVTHSSRCENDGDPCHITNKAIGDFSWGKTCVESSRTSDCFEGINESPSPERYQIRGSKILGAVTNTYRRVFVRALPLRDQRPGENSTGMKPRIGDTFTALIPGNIQSDPFDVVVVNAVALCDESTYKQEKPNFEKFLMSLKFRGKPLVPKTEKWQAHKDVYCDACPPEKSEQKPTVH